MLIKILLSNDRPAGENLDANFGRCSNAARQTTESGAAQDNSVSPVLY
jgi:hypothetical protein